MIETRYSPRMAYADAEHVRRALLSLRRGASVPLAFGGPVAQGKTLRLTEFAGEHTGSLHNLAVSNGDGLGGKVVALGRPATVTDYEHTPAISHRYDRPVLSEGLRSIVAVPVVVGRTVRAVLYGAIRQPLPLGDRVLSAVADTARNLGQDLAVRDETDRRLAELGAATAAATDVAQRERVREVHTELRALAAQTEDFQLRHTLTALCAKLTDPSSPDRPELSGRELDVLSCVALGHTNAVAARTLGLLPETVKSYLRSAMRKLGAHSRLEALTIARGAGLLP
jgi:DNA-binding CsgD family transcriptional regulator